MGIGAFAGSWWWWEVAMVVVGMGSLWVYSGDGFIVMEVAIVWVRFRWHLGLWAFGLDFSGVCIIFVGIWVVIGWLNVAEFWWKVLCVFARERDKKVKRNERWKSRKRN